MVNEKRCVDDQVKRLNTIKNKFKLIRENPWDFRLQSKIRKNCVVLKSEDNREDKIN